jgi:hypothetical protein
MQDYPWRASTNTLTIECLNLHPAGCLTRKLLSTLLIGPGADSKHE